MSSRNTKFVARLAVLLTVVAIVIAGCAPATTPTAVPTAKPEPVAPTSVPPTAVPTAVVKKTIKLAFPSPMTSKISYTIDMMCKACQMAVEDINAAGGVLGMDLEVACMDDAGDPKQAVVLAHAICADPDIVAIYGHVHSGCTIPAEPIYNECRMPVLTHSSSPDVTSIAVSLGFDNIYQPLPDDEIKGRVPADYMFNELGVKSAAVIHNKTIFGEVNADRFRKRAEEIGLRITSFQGIDQNDVDFSAVLTKIKAENPEGIYLGCYPPESALIRKQMVDMGMTQVFFGTELLGKEYGEAAGEAVAGTYSCHSYPPFDYTPEIAAWAAKFEERWGTKPELPSMPAYQHIYALADAITRAGSTDQEAIIKALGETNYQGLFWPVKFDSRHRLESPTVFIWRWTGPGTLECLTSVQGVNRQY